jgi:hypothetical protein
VKEKRFEVVYKQGMSLAENIRVIVDKKTRVQYLTMTNGYAGGMTVLVDSSGKPLLATNTEPEFD